MNVAEKTRAELAQLADEIASLTDRISIKRTTSSRPGTSDDIDLHDLNDDLARLRSRQAKLQTRLQSWASAYPVKESEGQPVAPVPDTMADVLRPFLQDQRKVAVRVGELTYFGTIEALGKELVRVKVESTFPELHPRVAAQPATIALSAISCVHEGSVQR